MPLDTGSELEARLEAYFSSKEEIRLAVLFGSVARGDEGTGSDVDIAIEWEERPSLLDMGGLAGELESIADRKIDLVELSGLASREPYLAFRIASEGRALREKTPRAFTAFKTYAFIRYFDVKDFLDHQAVLFSQRIEKGDFGRARHA